MSLFNCTIYYEQCHFCFYITNGDENVLNTILLDICLSLNLDNYVMLPPEGPNQISNCGEKRPLDDSQRQSVLVQQKNGKNF